MVDSPENLNVQLIISLVIVLSASCLPLQIQVVLLFKIWQQH